MKSRCSLGRVMLAAWFVMLCLGFVIAKSSEVAAAPNQTSDAEIKRCEGLFDTCNRGCDSSLSPEAAAKCKSNCSNRYQIHCSGEVCTCQTGLGIKPTNKALSTALISKQGISKQGLNAPQLQRRGIEGEQPDAGMANPSGTSPETK